MSAWNDYVEWSGLDESKLAHPAGKGVPESCEVAEARMDAEAIALANRYSRVDVWHHHWSSRPRWVRAVDVAVPVLMVAVLFGLITVASMLGELVGGWTA